MSTTLDALHNLRKFAREVRGLLALEEQLKEFASVEDAIAVERAKLADLREQEGKASAAIETLYADADIAIAERRAVALREIAEKHRKADQVIDESTEKAARIISAASAEAAGFAQRAEEHREAIASHNGILNRLKAEIVEHAQARDEAQAAAATARQQHENEKEALRAFRNRFTAAVE